MLRATLQRPWPAERWLSPPARKSRKFQGFRRKLFKKSVFSSKYSIDNPACASYLSE